MIEIPNKPSVALVLSTFGSVPYVHTHLELIERRSRQLKVLVHDDCSPDQDKLAALCEQYGATFVSNPTRLKWRAGDLSSFIVGLERAERAGIDLLVKFSRRFLPLVRWQEDFMNLAVKTQGHTYSNENQRWGFGFRTDCVGMHVKSWMGAGIERLKQKRDHYVQWPDQGLVEHDVHTAADAVHAELIAKGLQHKYEKGVYVPWPLTGTNSYLRRMDVLWHDTDSEFDYCRVARSLGLPYDEEEFKKLA